MKTFERGEGCRRGRVETGQGEVTKEEKNDVGGENCGGRR